MGNSFTTDGCTFFPDGWWRQCCVNHDFAYVILQNRLYADWDLATCVAGFGGVSVIIAVAMFLGIRCFGWIWWLNAAREAAIMYGDEMAVTQKFLRCHNVTKVWEGGWSNHPADPGGKTMYGVTEAVYHAWLRRQGKAIKPVRNITMDEALEIYFNDYWKPCGGPTLAVGVDLATYDASVNSGVSRGRKWLLASVGGPDHETVKKICQKRLSFVQGLTTWKVFGKGWGNRIADIQAKGVAWALAAQGDNAKAQLEDEASEADKEAKQNTGVGGASGAGGAGSAGAGAVYDVNMGMIAVAVVVLAIVAAFFIWRGVQKRREARAYEREAGKLET